MSILPEDFSKYHTDANLALVLAELRPALASSIGALVELDRGPPNKRLSTRSEIKWGNHGSLTVCISGAKKGLWNDHEAVDGGDALKWIRQEHNLDFIGAVKFGCQFVGIQFDREGRQEDPYVRAAREAERARKKAEDEAAQAADNAKRIAKAQGLWAASTPVTGTLGERYLIETRRIPRPPGGLPDVIRYHPGSCALILAGTDDSGAVQCVQRVYLTPDARKISAEEAARRGLPPNSKGSNGVMAGAVVRLPGASDGPLLLAEGPETGLSACAATGCETWIVLGKIIRSAPPLDRDVIVLMDDDDLDADKLIYQWADTWTAAGATIFLATPWAERRRDKTDFNDTIKAGGIAAVRARIQAAVPWTPTAAQEAPAGPHYKRPHLSGDAASRRLRQSVQAYFNRVELHLKARDWIAAEAERLKPSAHEASAARIEAKLIRNGMDPSEAAELAHERAGKVALRVATTQARKPAKKRFGARAASGEMPRRQIRGAAGLGKTWAIIDEYLARPSLWNRHIAFYTDTLENANKFQQDLNEKISKVETQPGGPRPRAIVIQGRQTEGMCHPTRQPLVKLSHQVVGSVHRANCHTPGSGGVPETFCPFHGWCSEDGYISQFANKAPAIRIMTHARISRTQPTDLRMPDPDIVIVDEAPLSKMVVHSQVDPASLIDHATYSSESGEEQLIQEAMDTGRAVADAVTAADAVEALRTADVTPEQLRAAAKAARLGEEKSRPRVWAGMDAVKAKSVLGGHKRHPGGDVAAVMTQLARDIEAGRSASIGIEWDPSNEANLDDGTKVSHPIIRRHGLSPAHGAPRKTALLMLDADADLEVNQQAFGADLRSINIPAVRQTYVIQVSDKALSRSSIAPDPKLLKNNVEDAERLCERLGGMIENVVSEHSKTVVFSAAQCRRAITGEKGDKLEPVINWKGADFLHFGRHLGKNQWKDFNAAVIIGREQIAPLAAERMARAVYANAPDVTLNLSGTLTYELRRHDMRHGTSEPVKVQVNADPRVQTLMEFPRESAMAHAADRLRLIHRSPDNPGVVLIASNLPVPGLVVDRLITLRDLLAGGTDWERMVKKFPGGVLPLSADWLTANAGDILGSKRNAERFSSKLLETLEHEQTGSTFLKPPFANNNLYWRLAVYRTNLNQSARRHSQAIIRSGVANPMAALAAVLGIEVLDFRIQGDEDPIPAIATPAPKSKKPNAIDAMAARGLVLNNPVHAFAVYSGVLFRKLEGARTSIRRAQDDISLAVMATVPVVVHYQVAGERNHPATAFTTVGRIATLRTELEAVLGPLASFEIIMPEVQPTRHIIELSMSEVLSWSTAANDDECSEPEIEIDPEIDAIVGEKIRAWLAVNEFEIKLVA